jgi:pSer/pThr/pTyr-binding forkhead associated (FHA) protein
MATTRAYLEIVDGPGKGRRILLRDGQVRYVGRTSQADDSCPENPTMSSVHFSVRWFAGQCELKDLNSANGTWRHGKKIVESLLAPTEEFKAGKSTFRLLVDEGGETRISESGEQKPGSDTSLDVSAPMVASAPVGANPLQATGLAVASVAALAPEANLSDDSKAMLVEDMPVLQFIELLASREQYHDALRVMAHALTKRSAVAWASRCVRAACGGDLTPVDEAALAAAEAWVEEPSEERRRKCEAMAEAAKHKTAASWAATAAFWSSGSLGPPTTPVVPPASFLTAHAAVGAAMIAAAAKQPEKAVEKYQMFLQFGKELSAAS